MRFLPLASGFTTFWLGRALFDFLNFLFALSFFSFSFLFATVIDLLLGLLAVIKTSKEASSRREIFTMEQPRVVAGNFALSFSLNFLSVIEAVDLLKKDS